MDERNTKKLGRVLIIRRRRPPTPPLHGNAGEGASNHKLTTEIVREAKRLYLMGWSHVALAALYNVPYSTMQNAVSGRTWAHIPWPRVEGARRIAR